MENLARITVLTTFLLLCGGSALSRETGAIEKFFGDVIGGGCSVVVGAINTGPCYVTYRQTVEPLSEPNHGGDDANIRQITSSFKLCCARAVLRACVLKSIEGVCGDKAEEQSKVAVGKVLHTAAGDDTCAGTEFIYQEGSPLCWSDSAQYTAVVILGLCLLVCCCVGILKRCC